MVDHRLVVPEHALRRLVAERAARRLVEDVGESTRRHITNELQAVGINVTAPWVYAETDFGRLKGERVAISHVVCSDRAGGMLGSPRCHDPHEWIDGQQDYRLEALGVAIATPEEIERCPEDVRYRVDLPGWLEDPILLAALRRRAIHLKSQAYARADWRPGQSAPEITHGGTDGVVERVEEARFAESLLRDFQPGRQVGRRRKREAQIRATVDPVVRNLVARGLEPTEERVAEHLPRKGGKLRNPRVVRRWVNEVLHLTWEAYIDSVNP
jgi:hypothetical protein